MYKKLFDYLHSELQSLLNVLYVWHWWWIVRQVAIWSYDNTTKHEAVQNGGDQGDMAIVDTHLATPA